MKKILALVLALGLLCGGVAMADNTTINQDSASKTASTTVSYTIAANQSYIVTIPSAVTLTQGEGSALTGSMTISLDAKSFNVPNGNIVVKLTKTANNYSLSNGKNEIGYNLTREGTSGVVTVNSNVLNWTNTNGTSDSDYQASSTFNITATIPAHAPAGDYTDTLTFTVSVSVPDTTTGSSENDSNAGGIENQELSDNMNVD